MEAEGYVHGDLEEMIAKRADELIEEEAGDTEEQ